MSAKQTWLAATPGAGSAGPLERPGSNGDLEGAAARKANILLVDDRPEKLLALEAVLGPLNQNLVRARSGKEATQWLYAATRMNGVGLNLRYGEREVWTAEILPWRDISSHREIYTTFMHHKTAAP